MNEKIKIMNYRKQIQENLNDDSDGYVLKTNGELINMIMDFGCGETEFHTADIERLIKENKRMVHIIEQSVGVLSLDSTYSEVDKKNTIKQLKHLIELYK